MSSITHKGGSPPETQKKERPGFFRGMLEGIRTRRDADAALDSYLACGEPSRLKEALETFAALAQKDQAKLLGRMRDRLLSLNSFPFESEERLRAIIPIADFLASAAGHVSPELREGCGRIRGALQKIVEDSSFYNSGNPLHQAAKQCCTEALWELEGGGREFWEERLQDEVTMDFTIRSLLSRESPDNPEESGWPILKRNLPKIALAIALCQSERKEDFFTSMLLDHDPLVLKSALAGSLYLPRIPPELFDIARSISKMGSGLDFESFAFIEGARFKDMLDYFDERQFEGARGLLSLYAQGARHLSPILANLALEMTEIIREPPGSTEVERMEYVRKAAEVLITMSGLSIPGVRIDIHREG